MSNEHNVGDVVFVVKKRAAIVVPMRIVEVNTKVSIERNVTTYVGQDVAKRLFDPYAAGDEVHKTPEAAYVSLVTQFETAIRKIVDQAIEQVPAEWGTPQSNAERDRSP